MKIKDIKISIQELDRIFPFFLILNENLEIELFGKSIVKLFPECSSNVLFSEQWKISRPQLGSFSKESFKTVIGNLCILEHQSKPGVQLKGHFEWIENSNQFIFYGTPAFTSTDQIIEHQLELADFSMNDTMFDLLHVLKTNEITNAELKELLEKVNDQKKELSLFKKIIDSSSDAIHVSYESGRLFYLNKVASERLGVDMKNPGSHFVTDFDEAFQMNFDLWRTYLNKVQSQELYTAEGINTNVETGEKFPVEVTAKLVEIAGKGMIIAISRDISERKKHEEILRLQQEKYQNIITNMNLGILEVDLHDKVIFCNSTFKRMSGYELSEIQDKEINSFLFDERNQLIHESVTIEKKNDFSDNYESLVYTKSRDEKWWLFSKAPNYNGDGELIGSILILLDITNQKKLEKDLNEAYESSKQASEAKEAFLANMSHEIRTPLNAIIGMLRELNREQVTDKQKEYLKHTDSAANHLLSIVNSILDMSKIEAGEFLLEEENFRLPALMENIESIFTGKAKKKGLDLNIQIDPNILPVLIGDASRLRQVFINLIDNAIKFTDTGRIAFKTKVLSQTKHVQKIHFQIIDTGIGMDAEFLSEIFSKFSQEEKSTSRRFGGTGLGMAITKELIEIMGGEIQIDSQKGKGTTIDIELSMAAGDPDFNKSTNSNVDEDALKNISVLLVEDNELNRFIASQSLSFMGCSIDEAENGLVALDKIKLNNYDIILMDIQMPEMDGVRTTKIIRENLKLDIPIIALTANAFKEDIDLYLKIGMNDYVTKPFQEAILFASMSKALGIDQRKPDFFLSTAQVEPVDVAEIDFSKLRELCHGNEKLVERMVELFIQTTSVSIQEMREALVNKDYLTISKVAHKLKPNILSMGIQLLEGKALELEIEEKKENISDLEFENKVHYFVGVLAGLIHKLNKKELL